jgi:hypothetical protein
LEASRAVYGNDQHITAFSELELASSLWCDVRWDAAIHLAEHATRILHEALGDSHPKVAPWLAILVRWREYKRRWELVGLFVPIETIKAVGRSFNFIAAWLER